MPIIDYPSEAPPRLPSERCTNTAPTEPDSILDRVLAREIDLSKPPPLADIRFWVGGRATGTAGNLGQLSSPAKTGKTAVIGAHLAATIKAAGLGDPHADTLGITSSPPAGKAVILIDTEQDPLDSHTLLTRSLRRLSLTPDQCPKWVRAFPLAGFSPTDLAKVLPELITSIAGKHGGIHSVLIDGGADFANNVNDPEEAAQLVSVWQQLAINYRFHLLTVVHSNEARKGDETARGWLGKQLRRKAESNLQLRRHGISITLFSEAGQRRAPIPQKDGPTFQWSDELQMHASVTGNPVALKTLEGLGDLANMVFVTGEALKYHNVVERIGKARRCTTTTAEKWLKRLKDHQVVQKNSEGLYMRT
jgi:hypothetical protein